MKKFLPAALLLGVVLFTSGFSLRDWGATLYDQIKRQAEGEFSALFNRRVTIERAGGIVIGQIDLINFQVAGLGRANKVSLTYNPVKYALAKGDMAPALTKITVVNGDFTVERDSRGDFPLLASFMGGGGAAAPPPFRGRLVLQNCRVIYADQRGFKQKPASFTVTAADLNGAADLRKKDWVRFSFSGKVPEVVKTHGSFELPTGRYELNVLAAKLGFEKWGNYTLPIPDFTARGGTADVELRLAPPKTAGWPVALVGRAALYGASADFQAYKVNAIAGELFFDDDKLSIDKAAGRLNNIPLTARGRFDGKALSLELASRSFFDGALDADLGLRLNEKPKLDIKAKFSRLNLATLAQQAPGVEGRADGSLDLAGPVGDLSGKLAAKLSGGLVFGQPMATLNTAFRIKDHDFLLDDLVAASGNVSLRASGTVSRDLVFDLRTEAAGLRLAGRGVFGKMRATLDRFSGRTRWQLTPDFLTSPLKNLTASGEVLLSDGEVGEQLFDEARGAIAIGGGKIDLSGEVRDLAGRAKLEIMAKGDLARATEISGRLVMPTGQLDLDLRFGGDSGLSGSLEGIAELSYFKGLTKRYGRFSGLTGFALRLGGTLDQPQAAAGFWLKKFSFNDIFIDDISGGLAFYQNKFAVTKPIIFQDGRDKYLLTGELSLDAAKIEASRLDLQFEIVEAGLASAFQLLYKVEGELVSRFSPSPERPPIVKMNMTSFALPAAAAFSRDGALRLYSANGKKTKTYLDAWRFQRVESEKLTAAAPMEVLGGVVSARASLKGPVNNLAGRLSGRIGKGNFRSYHFDSLDAAASYKDQTFKIEKALLTKGGGSLSARGDYSLKGELFLHAVANNLPLDIMELAFPGKAFNGAFNMNAGIDGPLDNLRYSLAAGGRNISLAGVDFDKASISITKKGNGLYLHELSLLNGGQLSSAYGSVSFDRPGKVALEANLKDGAFGLINLFTDQIKWQKGDSTIKAKASGTLAAPKINGTVTIADNTVYVKALAADLRQLSGSATIENNVLRINGLTGIWTGRTTKDIGNFIGFSGLVDLGSALAERGRVDLDLAFSPTLLYADFRDLYTGALDVKALSLKGPLYFDWSEGPLLQGSVEVSNAVITLPETAGGGPVFPLRLGLDVGLEKNVYAVMGNVATLNLSNVLMNLEINGGLNISGGLKAPDLLGRIGIRRGTVNIFNREFTLLTAELRKKYATYAPTAADSENTAVFRGEGNKPDLDITASVDVDNQEKEGGAYVKKKVNVLARLRGMIGERDEERGLKIALAGYTEDKTKSPPQFTPAAYSEQDLKVMLLPDFIKSLAGIGQPGTESQADANAVVADYLSSRVQSLLFRGLEREAEQRLGLESLTLEYNFGPKIGEAMGGRGIKGF